MKKLLSITIAICFAFGINAQDMQAPNDNSFKKEMRDGRLAEKLNLNETQKQKIKSIREQAREEMKSRGMDNREFRQNLRAKTEKDILAVLTPDQQVAFNEIKEERKERMQENSIKGKEGQNDGKAKACSGSQGKGCCKKDGGQAQGKGCCKKEGGQTQGCAHSAQTQGCSHGNKNVSNTNGTQPVNPQTPAAK